MAREHFLAARRLHGDIVELEVQGFLIDLDLVFLGFAGVLFVEGIEVVPQVTQAPDAGGKRAETLDLGDDDREGGQHLGKRAFPPGSRHRIPPRHE